MDIGFVGLGNMGSGMARSLLRAGHTVTTWNRSPEPAQELAKDGARVARSPAEAAATGVVLSMLADDHAVESVTLGSDGIREGLPAGGVHASMSTIGVALAERLAQAHAERGQRAVSAPVFGRPEAAAAAKLFVVAAGAPDAVERTRPAFDAIGQRTFVVGETPSQANVVKIAGNFLLACVLEGLAETTALAAKSGVAPAALVEVLTSTLFDAPAYRTYGKLIVERRFTPAGFKMPLGLKDVGLALAAGEKAAAPLPFASVLRDRFLEALAAGHADLDWSAIALVAERDAGIAPAKS